MSQFRSQKAQQRRVAVGSKRKALNKRQKQQVKSLISRRQELKFYVSQTNAQAVSSAGVIFQLSVIPQGDTDTSRDGDRLYLESMHVKGSITIADTVNLFRLIFFQWKPTSTPLISNILLNGPSGGIDVYSHYNHDTRQEFKILFDRLYHQEGNSSAAVAPYTPTSQIIVNFMRYKMNRQLQYQGGGTTGTNQIYYIAISDSGVIPHSELDMSVKFLFRDS